MTWLADFMSGDWVIVAAAVVMFLLAIIVIVWVVETVYKRVR